VSLPIEMDNRTGFLDCFTHAGGKQARTSELKRNLIAVLLAQSTNLGLTRMADACGISYDILAWTAEWYVREETLRAANLALIGYHQRLALTPVFGTGTLSSSDGQRFPTRGKSVTARALSRYFAHEGLSTYTHVTDQHTTYGTKIIVATKREAHYVLDEILGNATDIPITEHATDTHGVTLVNFGLFDLLGLQLSPRIRDLGKITLYRTGPKSAAESAFPLTGPLLARKLNTDLAGAARVRRRGESTGTARRDPGCEPRSARTSPVRPPAQRRANARRFCTCAITGYSRFPISSCYATLSGSSIPGHTPASVLASSGRDPRLSPVRNGKLA
jgi:hypothetical protein